MGGRVSQVSNVIQVLDLKEILSSDEDEDEDSDTLTFVPSDGEDGGPDGEKDVRLEDLTENEEDQKDAIQYRKKKTSPN